MKQRTDRRKTRCNIQDTNEDNGRGRYARERRRQRDRRLANLDLEERRLLRSEMPGLTPGRRL